MSALEIFANIWFVQACPKNCDLCQMQSSSTIKMYLIATGNNKLQEIKFLQKIELSHNVCLIAFHFFDLEMENFICRSLKTSLKTGLNVVLVQLNIFIQ